MEADRIQAAVIFGHSIIHSEAYLRHQQPTRGRLIQQLLEGPYNPLSIHLNIETGLTLKQVIQSNHKGLLDIIRRHDIRRRLQPGGHSR